MKRLAFALLAGCSDATPGSLLDGPRVLAVVAEPPVLAPESSTTLSAVTSLDGLPATPDGIAWRVCSPYAVVADPARDCAGDAALALATIVVEAQAVIDRFALAGELPVDACGVSRLSLTVVGEIELAGVRLVATKQLAIGTATLRNPVFVQARIDGAPFADATAATAGSTIELGADIAVDSLDTVCEPDGTTRAEEVRVVVYPGGGAIASDESFDIVERDGVVEAGSVDLDLPDATGEIPLWLVAVDETGGAAARYFTITTR